ncbi:MAG TPA: GtrA family protein [Acidimicrobiales bacterium]|nr:GtrA family protein [Acidimicrobiales bacterium]
MRYQRSNGLSDAVDGLSQAPSNGGPVAVADSELFSPPSVAEAPAAKRVHPVHWLVDGHWLGRWRTPLLLKMWRYGAGSIVAFVTSVFVVYACFSWLGLGATTSAVLAFVAGAVPNWILNRRWAWQQRGREGVGRETSLYVLVSVVSLVASTAVTKLAAVEANHVEHVMKDLLVTASYTFSIVVLTILKYLAYDRWVFVNRSGARSSRHQVPTTTEPNRNP